MTALRRLTLSAAALALAFLLGMLFALQYAGPLGLRMVSAGIRLLHASDPEVAWQVSLGSGQVVEPSVAKVKR